MNLNRNQKVVVLVGLFIIYLTSIYTPLTANIYSLGAYPGTFYITVKDVATQAPIQGAAVSVYVLGSTLVGSGVTGASGLATVSGFYEQQLTIKVVAMGYADKSEVFIFFGSGTESATVLLTANPGDGSFVTVNIYCVTGDNYRVKGVRVASSKAVALTDDDGYAAVLCPEGQTSLSFSGEAAVIKRGSTWETLEFSGFNSQVAASNGATYTAYVQSAYVEEGPPGGGGGGLGDLWGWLSSYTYVFNIKIPNYIFVAAAFLLLVLGRR